jgi:signal transduction histidine kinase
VETDVPVAALTATASALPKDHNIPALASTLIARLPLDHPHALLCLLQYVFCDPDRLRGILLNLYTNAAKFTKRGHIVLRARCVARDYTPPAPAGYSAIMLQPSYHPSSSSHR